ncbi:MAG: glycosyltransferase family 2 protein [Candidatus Omnitrophota bacterium]
MGPRKDNTIVVIPSYNEVRTIGSIVADVKAMGFGVFVMDDGSTDNTERAALDNGAMVVRHKKNLGKGFSVREGIKQVLTGTNFEWMFIMDGDGQHHPEDITVLMDAVAGEGVDIVIGNRMLSTKTMPFTRYWTNKFTSWVVSGLCKQHIPDSQCGYRLIKVSSLKKLKLTCEKYDIETEMLIQAAENGMRIKSVPIKTIYGEEVSAINPLRDTLKFCMLVLRYCFKKW